MALCFGCAVTLLVMAVLYIPRGVVTFSGYVEGFLDGFKLVTPALLVLTFAWGLKPLPPGWTRRPLSRGCLPGVRP